MGVATRIEWTAQTWSPWHGCARVSPGCARCYAERMSGLNPAVLGTWGPAGTRVVTEESGWRKPRAWDRRAAKTGMRGQVFPSVCDPFEDRPDLAGPRARFFRLIRHTPNLDWLPLTKRPENIGRLWPAGPECPGPGAGDWPNLWLGASAEDQPRADERMPALLSIPAAVRFVSAEPLLGPVDLTPWLPDLGWVIAGGESGPRARPCDPDWLRSLRDRCRAAGTAFFCKQLGSAWSGAARDKGGDLDEFPPDLRTRESPR